MAYRTRNDRSWLTADDAGTVCTLLAAYRATKDDLPERVRRALWHADRSSHCRYLNECVTHIVTGMEALLNTGDDEPVTAQFVKRSRHLATELGIEASGTFWNWVYDARSKAVHGEEVTLVVPAGWDETTGDPPADLRKIARAQDVLRTTIRRAIEEEVFRQVFTSDESIRERWPLA